MFNVRIRFQNKLADAIINQFRKDVIMMYVDKEHFTVTVPVEVSTTFFACISNFTIKVKVLEPKPVVVKCVSLFSKPRICMKIIVRKRKVTNRLPSCL